jgi:SAM-dependent methyltransferase
MSLGRNILANYVGQAYAAFIGLVTVPVYLNDFVGSCAARYAQRPGRLLDIALQVDEEARPYFPTESAVETLEIDPKAGAAYAAELCGCRAEIPDGTFDSVVCTEVLEHTRQPFEAVENLWRILRPRGICFVTTPSNGPIHGPLPDCWRFTGPGLRELCEEFELLELTTVDTPERFLKPIHCRWMAQKPNL